MENTIRRICEMEKIFDALYLAAKQAPEKMKSDQECVRMMNELASYYEGGQWLRDYETDEKGLLPKELKRGVLSQDGVYNLISEFADMISSDAQSGQDEKL